MELGTVLVIDDGIRNVTACERLVRRLGFNPVSARTFDAGVSLIRSLDTAPVGALLDVILNGGRLGNELVPLISERFGEQTSIAMMSAYKHDDNLLEFIHKPGIHEITRFLVRSTVAAALDGNRLLAAPVTAFVEAFQLTAREARIVGLLSIGCLRTELAAALGVTENTCKTQVRHLLARVKESSVKSLVVSIQRRAHEFHRASPRSGEAVPDNRHETT